MPPEIKTVRRSQAIRPFGPGSIIEMEGDSFIVCTSDQWAVAANWERIEEPRLQALLHRTHFVCPPAVKEVGGQRIADGKMPVNRFPKWHFCKRCRRMDYLTRAFVGTPKCQYCHGGVLVPMRFVMACSHGHIGDVPWYLWVHKKAQGCEERYAFKFKSSGRSGGLESLFIECLTCGASASLAALTAVDTPKYLKWRCSGRQPWMERGDAVQCGVIPRVIQKGAGNAYFPQVYNSIDIPPHSSYVNTGLRQSIINHSTYGAVAGLLTALPVEHEMVVNFIKGIAKDLDLDEADVQSVLLSEVKGDTLGNVQEVHSFDDLTGGEYKALCSSIPHPHPKDNFIKHDMTGDIEECIESFKKTHPDDASKAEVLFNMFDHVVLVSKLRIVSVLKEFYRLYHPGGLMDVGAQEFATHEGAMTSAVPVAADLGSGRNWLPGIESFGEGVFISFKTEPINKWETQASAIARGKKLAKPPAFIMLHTIAHALVRQAAFEAGYSMSSIAERIYCDHDEDGRTTRAGVLIYTATGDSEGSLGGLARMARPQRFYSLFSNAISELFNCSNDPLCADSEGQGFGSRNLAACHGCCLVPETSCSEFNSYLDRLLVIGSSGEDLKGFCQNIL